MTPTASAQEESPSATPAASASSAGQVKLNLGCGPVQPEGWINVDGSNRAKLAGWLPWVDKALVKMKVLSPTEFGSHVKVLNLTKRMPYDDNSVDAIYSGEMWEHFELPQAADLTKECFRILKPGGVLRVCVPDGVAFWQKYLKLFDAEMAKPRKDRDAKILRDFIQLYFNDIPTRRIWLGSMGHTHKWQFDEIQLIEMFENAGLSEVDRATYHESRIEDVAKLERSNFLIVEGVKPG